ncbi:hypothetical protein Cgig2_004580 [Carnegiea gigantea]|uniref:Transmembrane protein n=1 Tax=Carnegiea gigantea TaxID=171969 RepID=A0A9Q1JXW0_9CARY|nr:hypothetical protein Cgig2_004580 [Carnegiea gigantea]
MNLKKTPPQSCRSVDDESNRTIHAANAPLRRWRVGIHASVCGLGLDFSASIAQIAESTGTSYAANAPLRRRRVGVRAFVVMVLLYFSSWFRFGGLEGRRRKKAVSRRLHWRSSKSESIGPSHATNAPLRRKRVGVHAFVVMVLLYFSAWIGFGGLEGRRRKKAVSRRLRRRRVLHMRHPSVADLMFES